MRILLSPRARQQAEGETLPVLEHNACTASNLITHHIYPSILTFFLKERATAYRSAIHSVPPVRLKIPANQSKHLGRRTSAGPAHHICLHINQHVGEPGGSENLILESRWQPGGSGARFLSGKGDDCCN